MKVGLDMEIPLRSFGFQPMTKTVFLLNGQYLCTAEVELEKNRYVRLSLAEKDSDISHEVAFNQLQFFRPDGTVGHGPCGQDRSIFVAEVTEELFQKLKIPK